MVCPPKGRFILSYNNHPDIWRFYKDFPYRLANGHYPISHQLRGLRFFGEVIITNF